MSLNPIDSGKLADNEVDPGTGAIIGNNAQSMNKYHGQGPSKKSSHLMGATGMNGYSTRAQREAAKKKANPVVLALIVLLAVAAVGAAGFFAYRAFNGPAGGGVVLEGQATVTIPAGYGTGDIIDILYGQGIITDRTAFGRAVTTAGAEGKLQAGTYTFDRGQDFDSIVSTLVDGRVDSGVTLTIPEGLTVAQTAQRVSEAFPSISAEAFMAQAKASNYANAYPFLAGAYADSLEGFLFPKTYSFAENATCDQVIRAMLDQFKSETAGLDWSLASFGDVVLDEYHVVIMASLIEKETAVELERPFVASVIFNRLNAGMLLQIDASIAYALNKYDLITYDDLAVDTPYNTYMYYGLCPGPISSPSLSSIQAVFDAALRADYQSEYYYYVAAPALDGTHTFCKTYEEFEVALSAYNQAMGF